MINGEAPQSPEQIRLDERHAKVATFITDVIRPAQNTVFEAMKQKNAIHEFESRDYQLEAWASIWQARDNGADRALIRLATGLGKTSVAVFDYAKFRAEQVALGRSPRGLFVVHQNNILAQASGRFEEILPVVSQSRFNNQGNALPTTEFTFATFQSLKAAASRIPPGYFDYIIYDEAHHIEADTYKQVVDHFEPQFQLGMTATPNRLDRRDITEHFGEPLYSKTLPEAIKEGHLASVDYRIMSDDAVNRALKDGFQPRNTAEIRALFEVQSRNDVIIHKILEAQEEIKQQAGIDFVKTIVFCDDIEVADEYATLLNGESYHSNIKPKEQHRIFNEFANGKFETITVRDMFNEGVDIPDARLLVFLRTTQSKNLFEQQLGRGLRKNVDKDQVTVLDFVANIDRLILLEEMAEVIFNEDTQGSFDSIYSKDINTVLVDETNRFIFSTDIIDLLHAYNQLIQKEGRSKWITYTNDEIVQLAIALSPHKPLYVNDIYQLRRSEFPSLATIQQRFGSLIAFQRECGFEIRDWSESTNAEIVALALAFSPDKAMTTAEVTALDRAIFPGTSVIRARFGTWANFQQECGFYAVNWDEFSNDELVDLALQLSPDTPLTSSALQKISNSEFPSSALIAKRFGGLIAFHQACGFEVSDDWLQYDNQDIIDLALKLSPHKPLVIKAIREIQRNEFPSAEIIYKRFGSMRAFHEACGFKIRPQWGRYSNEEIADIAKKLSPDKPLSSPDIEAYDATIFPSVAFIRKRFGTINLFHEACGFTSKKQWSAMSIDDIVKLALSISPDRALSLKMIGELGGNTFPSSTVIYEKFGSLVEFHRACGFEAKERVDWSKYSNDEIVALGKKLSNGKPLGTFRIKELPLGTFPSAATIIKRFGSLAAFHEACGYDMTNKYNYGR